MNYRVTESRGALSQKTWVCILALSPTSCAGFYLKFFTVFFSCVKWGNKTYVLVLLFGLNDTIFKASLNGGLGKGRWGHANTPGFPLFQLETHLFPFKEMKSSYWAAPKTREVVPTPDPSPAWEEISPIPSTSLPASDPRPRASSSG